MRKFNWKKSVAIALSTVCMVGALVGCGSNSASSDNGNDGAKAEKLSGSITWTSYVSSKGLYYLAGA